MEKKFNFKLTFKVNEDHPLYEHSNREIVAELAILLMNVTSIDPMLGYE